MKHRRDLPLSLLAAMGEDSIEGRTRLQKLLFLIQKRVESDEVESLEQSYDFIAYDYGPFSKEIYEDIDQLAHRGLVREEKQRLDDGVIEYNYKLTEKGKAFVAERGLEDVPDEFEAVIEQFGDENLNNIIDYVYSEYPDYTENSVLR